MRRLAASLLCLLLVCCGTEPDRGAPERIVLVVADTLRADHVGAYGGAVPTPNLDALAERGEIFEQALASYHQTSMSMASLFTGLTPSIEAPGGRSLPWAKGTFCGMARFRARDEACVPASLTTLAEDLSLAGYATLGVTSNPLVFRPYGFDQGFDVYQRSVEPDESGCLAVLAEQGATLARLGEIVAETTPPNRAGARLAELLDVWTADAVLMAAP